MTEETNNRFPCSDEHVPKTNYPKEIVDSINQMNQDRFGPLCKCGFYEAWCTCKDKEE